jgi:predicted RNA-binding protein with PUA domain
MPEHRVVVSTPPRELGNADAVYEVFADGEKFGELRISRGGVDWWPGYAKRGALLTWEQFGARMERT